MTKSIGILIVTLAASINACCQFTYFNIVYNTADVSLGNTLQYKVFVEDSTYISFGSGYDGAIHGVYLNRTNSTGVLVHQEVISIPFGFAPSTSGTASESIVQYESGMKIMAVTDYQCGYPTLALIAIESDFDTLWTRIFPEWNSCDGYNNNPYSIQKLFNDNVLCISYNWSTFQDGYGLHFTEIDTLGNVVEDVLNIYDNDMPFHVQSFRQISDDKLILWGVAGFVGVERQHFFIKTTLTGELLDEYYFGNPDGCNEVQVSCHLKEDGKLAVFYDRCIDQIDLNYRYSEGRYFVFNPSTMQGTPEFVLDLPIFDDTNSGILFQRVRQTPDSGYVCLIVDQYVGAPFENYVCKTDSLGNIEWYNSYFPNSPDGVNALYDIENALDGGFIATGEATPWEGGQYHWMLKIDSCGYEVPGFCITDGIGHPELVSGSLQVWPNPFSNTLKMQLPATTQEIQMLDALGRVVYAENVYYPYQQINLGKLEDGVYLLQAVLEDGRTEVKRVVKR